MSDSVYYQWAIAVHEPSTERGKRVLAHAYAGSCYYLLNPHRSKNESIVVGFKYVADGPQPHHIQLASPSQAEKLDKLSQQRMGRPAEKREPSQAWDMFPGAKSESSL